ncbi:ribosomal large subunit pseudouridine synthase B [Metamycoplasma arthritidis]|uniref:Pseudouridine synthase n=1 Tax=Metamycoplasma arthritidis (strain 158L3-1) TaxID=243272 RepID=B3PMD0_META1|nr:pseudouridine synthase [Metamycoplasma arthritidis]ACF07182.1 ribosomal large subunit pseudouridine synthase B [Metamycoplasma arthritidis 158L3-1]VEU78706.1 ribosomal large subunit pseudouridine synthase B [Metamycoplasma arthritidis]
MTETKDEFEKTIKIQKAISQVGYCSRRQAEELIKQKRIKINHQVATLGQRVLADDQIFIDGKKLNIKPPKFYLVFNKPKNTICTLKDPEKRKTIYEYMGLKEYAYSVGRLDFNSTGIILVTNDGDFANLIAHPSANIKRVYEVVLEKELSEGDFNYLNSNKVILNGKKSSQSLSKLAPFKYSVSLYEGRNHHVKNLFLLVNNYVKELHRVSYGPITDANLKIGKTRHLSESEVQNLKTLALKQKYLGNHQK